ncbi:hypothetical protein BLOT_010475 [Blomia tropicalis]|nr:hypothetical protein BLOT_010475 [Blomia tropicalis]
MAKLSSARCYVTTMLPMTNQCNYPHHATALLSPPCNSITITVVQQHHHHCRATASPSLPLDDMQLLN